MITDIRSLAYHYDARDMHARARQARLAREARAHSHDARHAPPARPGRGPSRRPAPPAEPGDARSTAARAKMEG